MGIPVRNPEGYKDPTAAEAINNIEREAKRIGVGDTVRYKLKKYKVEYIGWMKGELMVKLGGVSGMVPFNAVKKV